MASTISSRAFLGIWVILNDAFLFVPRRRPPRDRPYSYQPIVGAFFDLYLILIWENGIRGKKTGR
ncbi:MAG TPA: hypothetical protein PKW95_00115 [bacterium]|nr:hypothetical protein [bacterium]